MDWNSETGQKLAKRLKEEQVIWLTTVRPNGAPVPTPVWFLWDGESFLIYTQPGSPKMTSLAANLKAALNLNCDEWGGDVAVFTGEIEIARDAPPANQNAAYLEKYRSGITNIQMTPESFIESYSIPLRMKPKHIRAW
jgi:PPOX class probable F420-dependent enzyme